MTSATTDAPSKSGRSALGVGARRGIKIAVFLVVVLGIVLGTKVVPNDSDLLQSEEAFDADTFGSDKFPDVQEDVVANAMAAPELADAISQDQEAAEADHANPSSGGPVFPVTFTGTVGEGNAGIYTVDVDGVADVTIRVQTGPAINGTELRDATTLMPFGDFENQIQYQDAAAALNEEMKEQVLADIDTDDLEGKTVTVSGAFTLVNPEGWLVTPVEMEVQ